jgi:hypothetical protein
MKKYYFSALALFSAVACSAAPITWSTATDTGSKADLIEGTVVVALNGGATSPAIIGGGVGGTSNYVFSSSDFSTINFTATGADAGDSARAGAGTNQYSPSTITSTGDTDFDSLLATVAYSNGTPSGIVTGTMTIEGLIVDSDYQIQLFFNDQRILGHERVMIYGDGLGNTTSLSAGDPTAGVQTEHYGQFVVGSFTADATTQELTMDSSATASFGNVHYSAILVTGPTELNVAPILADASFEVPNGTLANTSITTLVGFDGNSGDSITYTITAGDEDSSFSLNSQSGELSTAKPMDVNIAASYSLTVEVSDGIAATTATIDITVVVPDGEAAITWGPAQNTTSAADLVSGSVAFARNGSGNDLTVGGVLFESISIGTGFLASVYPAGGIQSTGDTDFDSLISSLTYGGGANTIAFPGHITGLTPGKGYLVQVFFNDQRTAASGRLMAFSDTLGNSVDVGAGAILGTGEADDYGQFAVGEFVAAAPTQILQLTPGGAGFGNSHMNAILVVETAAHITITEISRNAANGDISLTWTSTPNETFAIKYSLDLLEFTDTIEASIPASANATTTTTFAIPGDIVEDTQVYFRLEQNS